jgi:hypothetical protein
MTKYKSIYFYKLLFRLFGNQSQKTLVNLTLPLPAVTTRSPLTSIEPTVTLPVPNVTTLNPLTSVEPSAIPTNFNLPTLTTSKSFTKDIRKR